MTMMQVIDHTVDQLSLIYEAFIKERAEQKLMDMDVLAGVISAGNGNSEIMTTVQGYLKDQRSLAATQTAPPQNTKKNRQAHVALLMSMGAKQI